MEPDPEDEDKDDRPRKTRTPGKDKHQNKFQSWNEETNQRLTQVGVKLKIIPPRKKFQISGRIVESLERL